MAAVDGWSFGYLGWSRVPLQTILVAVTLNKCRIQEGKLLNFHSLTATNDESMPLSLHT